MLKILDNKIKNAEYLIAFFEEHLTVNEKHFSSCVVVGTNLLNSPVFTPVIIRDNMVVINNKNLVHMMDHDADTFIKKCYQCEDIKPNGKYYSIPAIDYYKDKIKELKKNIDIMERMKERFL